MLQGLLAYASTISAGEVDLTFCSMDQADAAALDSAFVDAAAAVFPTPCLSEDFDLVEVAAQFPRTLAPGAVLPVYPGDGEIPPSYSTWQADQDYSLYSLTYQPQTVNVSDWGDVWPLESSVWRSIAARYQHTLAAIPACPTTTHDDQSTPRFVIHTPKPSSRTLSDFVIAGDYRRATFASNNYISGYQYIWAGQELPYWHILNQSGFTPRLSAGQVQLYREWNDGALGGITAPNPDLGFTLVYTSGIFGGQFWESNTIEGVGSYNAGVRTVRLYPKPLALVGSSPLMGVIMWFLLAALSSGAATPTPARRRKKK